MDTYIIRLDRRRGGDPNRIVGHVEKVEVKERLVFFNPEMLLDILASLPPPRRKYEPQTMVDVIRAIAEEENL
jgi:hypothetical protein